MLVDVALKNHFHTTDLVAGVDGAVCAVIDVIRATSTVATLFGNGVKSIFIASTLEEALTYKERFPERVLCGEKDGVAPRGFDYGNSPAEFSRVDFAGKNAILKTTNGTASFLRAKKSPAVFSLAALNFRVTMEAMVKKASSLASDILLICSGQEGRVAYDDCYIAGMAVKYLMKKPKGLRFSDSAKMVLSLNLGDKNIEEALKKSSSAIFCYEHGLGEDVPFCARLNEYNVAVRADISGKIPELLLD